METVILNENNLLDSNVDNFVDKVRALISVDDKILVCDYNDVCLLPGGKIDKGEDNITALIRELKEEIGINYIQDELRPLFELIYYQSNYPTRDNKIQNRCIKTTYYIANYKGIDLSNINRTEEEIKNHFDLSLLSVDELYGRMKLKTNNPRKEFFDKELYTVLKYYQYKRP